MMKPIDTIEDLNHEDRARLILDMLHRLVMHHALWFSEVKHQMGMDKALETLETVFERSYAIQMKRLAETLGFEMQDGLPAPLRKQSEAFVKDLMHTICVNWLVNDGVWFQAVEFSCGMNDAKRCNDSTWGQFSPLEAWSVKRFLNLPEKAGLAGLKRALNFRLYANINTQSFVDQEEDSFVFQMNACRVQAARKRKGLEDYPCKSGGLVEYTTFAKAIDANIKTECIACPPDAHPKEWFCAWRFSMNSD
jgi:hypothetical protein